MTEQTPKTVEETQQLWKDYSLKRETWAKHAQEDREFRYGKQWTQEQWDTLVARGQAPVVVNRIHPAVEAAKAMLTSNKPSFRVSPREDSDNQVAQALNGVLEYIWQISDGDQVLRNAIDDYYVMGMGVILHYQDPMADMGKGEVMMKDIDPLTVYVDPNSRMRDCSDAKNIIISRLFTKAQASALYPKYKAAIKAASSDNFQSDMPVTDRHDEGHMISSESEHTNMSALATDDEYIRGYERYQKTEVDMYRIFESWNGREDLLMGYAFEEYLEKPAWIIAGSIVDDPAQANQMMMQIQQQYSQQVAVMKQNAQGTPPPPPEVQQVTMRDLVENGAVKAVKVPTARIKQTVVMGDKLLFQRILNTGRYPLVFYMNMHTRTPYPVSDVRMVRGIQEFINKTRSLIIAHATTSTNMKVMVPPGSVDIEEFERKWAQPGVAMEVDFEMGQPVVAQPHPLPSALYQNETAAKADIDHQLGLYEMMMGNTQSAPHTYKATVSLDEFGQRKMKSKLADIEFGLRQSALVAIDLARDLYREEKIIRLLKPNNITSEYMLNKRMYDDKGNPSIVNDISVGEYDVVVVTGSTLPTNRYAQLEMYMDAYEKGIVDKLEVLKKTEVFDTEGVLQRTDTIDQLQQQLQGAQEQIKKLQGDLQTREREVYHAKQKAELEKFKSDLDSTSTKAKAAGTVYEQRLNDSLNEIKKEVRDAISTKDSTPKKGSSKE